MQQGFECVETKTPEKYTGNGGADVHKCQQQEAVGIVRNYRHSHTSILVFWQRTKDNEQQMSTKCQKMTELKETNKRRNW